MDQYHGVCDNLEKSTLHLKDHDMLVFSGLFDLSHAAEMFYSVHAGDRT